MPTLVTLGERLRMLEDKPKAAPRQTCRRSARVIVAVVFMGLGLTWQPLDAQTGAVAVPRQTLWLLPVSVQGPAAPIQNSDSSGSALKGALIGAAIGGIAGWVALEVGSGLFCPDLGGGASTCTTPLSLSQSMLIGALVGGVIGAAIGKRVGSSGESERGWTIMPYVSNSSQLGLRTQWSIPTD